MQITEFPLKNGKFLRCFRNLETMNETYVGCKRDEDEVPLTKEEVIQLIIKDEQPPSPIPLDAFHLKPDFRQSPLDESVISNVEKSCFNMKMDCPFTMPNPNPNPKCEQCHGDGYLSISPHTYRRCSCEPPTPLVSPPAKKRQLTQTPDAPKKKSRVWTPQIGTLQNEIDQEYNISCCMFAPVANYRGEIDRFDQMIYLTALYAFRKRLDKCIYDYETHMDYRGCREHRLAVVPMTEDEARAMLAVETVPFGSRLAQSSEAVEIKEGDESEGDGFKL